MRSLRPAPRRWRLVLAATSIALFAGTAVAASSAQGAPAPAPFVGGEQAIARLGDRLPEVARERGLSGARLRAHLRRDRTLRVDRHGELAYFEVAAPGEAVTAAPASVAAIAAAPPTTGPDFQLASLPGAAKTIYLDFDGHVTEGTRWNSAYGFTTIVNPPYDLDGVPDSWSATELANIRAAWRVAAEDFAPFNVNVTTIDPGVEALRMVGAGDTQWGVRVVVTKDTFANCSCGGHAYIWAFGHSTDEPAFAYNTSQRGVAEVISHEVGHTLGLAHDGTTSGTTYYQGHGTGETSWAPIMGSGYYSSTTTWSQQEYPGANNTGATANYDAGADDLAIISSMTNGNNFGYRPDDHGESAGTATPLSGTTVSASGRIGQRGDIDAFRFSTGSGSVTLTVSPLEAPFADLDASLTIRDSGGAVVATADSALAHSSTWTGTLAAGTYSVEVDGVGAGNPVASPPTGYSDYGSLGQYTLTGQLATGSPVPSTSIATGQVLVEGAVSGALAATQVADGVSQSITEVVTGGKPAKRSDSLEHRWTIPALSGAQVLRVLGSVADGGDADTGMRLEWSTNGTTWAPLTTMTGAVNGAYAVGSPSGTVTVRVVDTNGAAGQRSPDTVRFDLLRLETTTG